MTKLSPEAQALLNRGRDALSPSAASKERVLSAIDASLASGAGVAGVSAFGTGKLWLVLTLVAGIGGGFLVFRNRADAPQQPSQPVASAEQAPPAPAFEPVAPDPEPATAGIAEASEPPVAAQEPAVVPKPNAVPRRSKKNTKKPASSSNGLLAESKLIADAQSALRKKDYTQARKLLSQHEKEFPRGTLRPERQAALAMANCLDGNGGKAIARRFLDAYPNSPLAPRVRTSCDLGDY